MRHPVEDPSSLQRSRAPDYPPVTIGVPTKDRTEELSRLLAALHAQTYTNWDLVIVNDSVGDMLTSEGEFWLNTIAKQHKVTIQQGAQINQCYSHNHVLWHPDTHDLILRMDDDLAPSRDFIEQLVVAWQYLSAKGRKVGGVGGLYFDQRNPRGANPPRPTISHPDATVHRDGMAYATAQMVDYSDSEPFEVEHIYSACLYSKEAMQRVGGWPLVYSDIVSHREETDGTYRMFLAGYKLYVAPAAKAKHEHGHRGGIRSISPAEHNQRRDADEALWRGRIFKLRGVNYRPSVALVSYHTDGVGGAQRLFYSLLEALQSTDAFERVTPIALGEHKLDSYSVIKDRYGLTIQALGERDGSQPPWMDTEFDVVISLGHEPPSPKELPPRRHHIHYNLFPTMEFGLPRLVDRYVAISLYSGEYLKAIYRRHPEIIYPYVEPIELRAELRKENAILLVGDIQRGKKIGYMVEAFLQMDLPPSTELHIVSPRWRDRGGEADYIDVVQQDPRIFVHRDISAKELRELYLKCKVLWAGRGYGASEPVLQEHFGYTVVEALRHYCVPIAFDSGGYRETAALRWTDFHQLEQLTKTVLTDREMALETLRVGLDASARFTRACFISDWLRVIMSLNAFAWEPQINEWRRSGASVEVVDKSVHIGCISDSPYGHTGYSVIAEQVYRGFLEQGYKTHVFAIQDHRADLEGRYYRYWPTSKSDEALDAPFKDFVNSHRFDAMWVARDPYTTARFLQGIRSFNATVPVVSFVSQEGAPAHRDWGHILNLSDEVITYSKASARAVYELCERNIDWVYLGADHAAFRAFSAQERRLLRQHLGWDDHFVVLSVARNARNKRHPLLLKAAKILKSDYGYSDLMVALHTQATGRAVFGGQDLPMWVDALALTGAVSFSPALDLPYETKLDEILSQPVFESYTGRKDWFRQMGLVGLYNAADVYVDVSAAEGFCLPNVEAMACGVPVISVDDGYVRAEVLKGAVELIRPSRVPDEWNTGADLWLVSAQDVAAAIHQIRTNDEKRERLIECGLICVEKLTWDRVRKKMVGAVESCQKKY